MTRTREQCLATLISYDRNPMGQQLAELFRTREPSAIPGHPHVFAIECQCVLREGGYVTVGALSIEENGILHMYQPASRPSNPALQHSPPIPILAHHYFGVGDLLTIVVGESLAPTQERKIVLG